MKLAFSILDWQASAPGLHHRDDWLDWAQQPLAIDAERPLDKCRQLPMMMARRLHPGSRLAVDCGLALLARQQVDAVVFTSRHGELQRNLSILNALANNEPTSPTDFAMSVHNAAVGSLTISAKAPLVCTSLSAGVDSFQQGLIEVVALQAAGYQQVLLVDFEGAVPDFYHNHLPAHTPHYPYAVALLLGKQAALCCHSTANVVPDKRAVPQSVMFLHGLLAQYAAFRIPGERVDWQWERADV